MRFADLDAWHVSEHAVRRYCERLAPRSEPLDLWAEPGRGTARSRVLDLIRGDLTLIAHYGRVMRVTPLPAQGIVVVVDQDTRTVMTLYVAEGAEAARVAALAARQRRVERRLAQMRYVYAAPHRRWPAWLR